MYNFPVTFPAASNRESWVQSVQISDDETGDPITLTDSSGNALYEIYLEIAPPRGHGGHGSYGGVSSSYYDECGERIIFASLADYITLPDLGVIQIQIPYTIMQTLRGGRTYDVFLRLEDQADDDARQLLIGKLPIAYGGRGP